MESQMLLRTTNRSNEDGKWLQSLSSFSEALGSGDLSQKSSLELLERGADDDPAKLHLLSQHLRQHSALGDALRIISKALARDPSNAECWDDFRDICLNTGRDNINLKPVAAWQLILTHGIDQELFVANKASWGIVNAVLQDCPSFQGLFVKVDDPTASASSVIKQAYECRLLLAFLRKSAVADVATEALIGKIRQRIIRDLKRLTPDEPTLAVMSALALGCFWSDYIIPEEPDESAELSRILDRFNGRARDSACVPTIDLLALACFRPLNSLAIADEIFADFSGPHLDALLLESIHNPQQEQRIKSGLIKLTKLETGTSERVKAQYEESPYPRWRVNKQQRRRRLSVASVLKGIGCANGLNQKALQDAPKILVAGCGTGQHALAVHSRFLNSGVDAFDLCETSLAYAIRKTDELKIKDLNYYQADINLIGGWPMRFDLIECCGVLHHLSSPITGWRNLEALLNPGGLMKIALYSSRARQGFNDFRHETSRFIKNLDISEMKSLRYDIIRSEVEPSRPYKELRAEAKNVSPQHPINSLDFYNANEVRDLLFHEQEHQFELPQIEPYLEELNLKFLGMELRHTARNSFIASFGKNALNSLKAWHNFELSYPDTFQGMYQMWFQKHH